MISYNWSDKVEYQVYNSAQNCCKQARTILTEVQPLK